MVNIDNFLPFPPPDCGRALNFDFGVQELPDGARILPNAQAQIPAHMSGKEGGAFAAARMRQRNQRLKPKRLMSCS
jgi:hypothetical protein